LTSWPGNWKPIESPSEAAAFEDALRRLVAPGHPLFELPLRAIARKWDDILVLFAFDDGSGRVVQVVVPWIQGPMEFPCPISIIKENRETWVTMIESRLAFQKLKPDPSVVPKYRKGARVMLLKHADWETDARATIVQDGRPRLIFDGTTHVDYMVEFDEPQPESNPPDDPKIPSLWAGTSVLEEYLRPLSPDDTPCRARRFRST
jgi:hypothetical protein